MADIEPCCNRGGALPQPAAPTDSVVTTRRQPVVTTRTQPQHARAMSGLSQVTDPRDVLPRALPGATLTVADDRQAACASRLRPPAHRPAVQPLSPGHGLEPTNRLAAASAVGANAACRGGQQQDPGTRREWCPVSLVVPVALRRSGRTETLTRPIYTGDNEPKRSARGNQPTRRRGSTAATGCAT
jgi:hypothetical protein